MCKSLVFLALGFTGSDSLHMYAGFNCGVRYYNNHLNAAMQELGL